MNALIDAWLVKVPDQRLALASWLIPVCVGLGYAVGFILYVAVWS